MKTKYILIVFALLFAVTGFSQKEKKYIREGNNLYEKGDFQEAEVQYRKALSEDPKNSKGKFNLGDAMYEQQNFDESTNLFNELTESNLGNEAKSGAYYNLGNSFLSAKKYKESIEAYKNALRQNPNDADAKYNLEYARKMLNEQQQQQQNQDQNQDQDKKDQDKQDQNKDQNKDQQDQKDQQDKDQDQQNDQQKQDQNKDNQKSDQQKQNQQPQPQQISKEDAQRMMEALKNDEKQTLQKLQEQKAKAAKAKSSDIDW